MSGTDWVLTALGIGLAILAFLYLVAAELKDWWHDQNQ